LSIFGIQKNNKKEEQNKEKGKGEEKGEKGEKGEEKRKEKEEEEEEEEKRERERLKFSWGGYLILSNTLPDRPFSYNLKKDEYLKALRRRRVQRESSIK